MPADDPHSRCLVIVDLSVSERRKRMGQARAAGICPPGLVAGLHPAAVTGGLAFGSAAALTVLAIRLPSPSHPSPTAVLGSLDPGPVGGEEMIIIRIKDHVI